MACLVINPRAFLTVYFLFVFWVHALPQQTLTTQALPSVTLTSGVVIGTTGTVTIPATSCAAVTQYFGIPYASSPPQRFSPGTPPPKWDQPLLAQALKPGCPEEFVLALNFLGREYELFENPGYGPLPSSEDCLYLNVYVPPGTKQGDGKAVMFWIFGGNFDFGSGNLHAYDGSSIAQNQDVIVVTHNYRTNVFGFPGSPQIDLQENNLGFLDQRMALNWVRDNIEQFGGDPSRVTIFGESAGGYSVRSLVGNPPDPLNFQGAIMESEASVAVDLTLPVDDRPVTSSWTLLATSAGCVDLATQLDCMRSIPWSTLVNISQTESLTFFPVEDGLTYTADIRPALEQGTAAKVPLILGTNKDEGTLVPYMLGLTGDDTTAVSNLLNILFPNQPILTAAIEALVTLEPVSDAISKIVTAVLFQCPGSQLAEAAQQSGHQIWRYLYNPSFPNLPYFPGAGAIHTSEIASVFGTYDMENSRGAATPQQIAISKYMQTAWGNFAKNPTGGPGDGWPELGASGNVNSIGLGSSDGGQTVSAASIDPAICGLINSIIGQQPL